MDQNLLDYAIFLCLQGSVVRILFFKKANCKKRAKKGKNDVFLFYMISIWVKKWTSWGCSIILTYDDIL
jgi:hypothetical protein